MKNFKLGPLVCYNGLHNVFGDAIEEISCERQY